MPEIEAKQNGELYTWELDDDWNSDIAKKSWDTMYPTKFIISANEKVSFDEDMTRRVVFDRKFMTAIQIRDLFLKQISKSIIQILGVQSLYQRQVRYNRDIFEFVYFKKSLSKRLQRIHFEKMLIEIDRIKNIKKNASERMDIQIGLTKSYEKEINESIEIEVSSHKFLKKYFVDTLTLDETLEKMYNKYTKESFEIAGILSRSIRYKRKLKEKLGLQSSEGKELQKNFLERLDIRKSYLRNANAVLSNLYYSDKELSFEAFKKIEIPVGYQPFRDFIIGDYSYDEAIFRTLVEGAVTSARPLITNWELNVDVPDINDRGTCTVGKGGIRVKFNKRFYAIPEVDVVVRGGLDAMPEYDVDETGFTIILRKGDQTIEGVISWSANGY